MNQEQPNDHWLDEQLAELTGRDEDASPPSGALGQARLAVRAELGMQWLEGAGADPIPSRRALELTSRLVRGELVRRTERKPVERSTTLRRLRLWIPSSVAACLMVAVGSVYWQSRPVVEITTPLVMTASLDHEFESDWRQLDSLESSLDEVEREFRGWVDSTPRRGLPLDFDGRINDLSDDLAQLENST